MKYVYKIVAALGALAAIPLLLFSKIFYFKFSSAALQLFSYLLQNGNNSSAMNEILQQNGGQMPNAIADSFSIYDIYDLISSVGGFFEQSEAADGKFDALITPVIVFVIIAIMLVVCAVITAIFAFVAKDNRKAIYSSVAGIGLSFMLNEAFEAISAPILDGTISRSTLLESWWSGLLGSVDTITLTNNFWFIPVVFVGVIIWTVIYNYTLPDDQKKERKLMLGEEE